jgi:cytoskeletal protein CcmA (bactofilin family)
MTAAFSFGDDEQELAHDDDLDFEEDNSPSSFVASDMEMKGKLKLRRGIEVAGAFSGVLASNSSVFVKPSGSTEGDMEAFCVVIEGTVRGKLTARKRLEIQGEGKFIGSLTNQPEAIVLSEFGIFGKDEETAEAFHREYARPVNEKKPKK